MDLQQRIENLELYAENLLDLIIHEQDRRKQLEQYIKSFKLNQNIPFGQGPRITSHTCRGACVHSFESGSVLMK